LSDEQQALFNISFKKIFYKINIYQMTQTINCEMTIVVQIITGNYRIACYQRIEEKLRYVAAQISGFAL
jgi:hypothetical protein